MFCSSACGGETNSLPAGVLQRSDSSGCARVCLPTVSNVIPTNPVVSAKSGHLYERSVIEKHIEVEGKCPHTGEAMSTDDLIAVKGALARRWCACDRCCQSHMVVVLFSGQGCCPTTSGSYFRARFAGYAAGRVGLADGGDVHPSPAPELCAPGAQPGSVPARRRMPRDCAHHEGVFCVCHATWRNACQLKMRVLGVQERDTARSQLQAVLSSSASNDVDMEGKESDGIPQRVLLRITTLSETLSKGRKKRPTPEGQASKDQIRGYTQQSSHKIHKSSSGGILCLAAHATNPALVRTTRDTNQTVGSGVVAPLTRLRVLFLFLLVSTDGDGWRGQDRQGVQPC